MKNNAEHLFGVYQCSFDISNRENAAKNFALSLQAKDFLRNTSQRYSMFHNEIVLRAWDEEAHPEKLPIEAFFYLINYSSAREKAFRYQSDYLNQTGEMIPVVGIRLPQPNDSNLIVELDEQK